MIAGAALMCLALNAYWEAGNQDYNSMVAVNQVVMNRVASDKYPNEPCEVILQGPTRPSWKNPEEHYPVRHRCQFSWYCDGKSDKAHEELPWARALIVADNVLRGKIKDPTKGATHYHARYVKPYWSASLNNTVIYGSHKFYQ